LVCLRLSIRALRLWQLNRLRLFYGMPELAVSYVVACVLNVMTFWPHPIRHVVQEGAPAPKPKRYPRIKGGRTIGLTGHARSWDLAQRFIRRSALESRQAVH